MNYNPVNNSGSPNGHQPSSIASPISNYQVTPQIQQLYLPLHQSVASPSHMASSSTSLQGTNQQIPPFSYVSQQNKYSQAYHYQYPIPHNFSSVPPINSEPLTGNNSIPIYNSNSSSSTSIRGGVKMKKNMPPSQIQTRSPPQPQAFSPKADLLKNPNLQPGPGSDQRQLLSPHTQQLSIQQQQKYQQYQSHMPLPPYEPSQSTHFAALPPPSQFPSQTRTQGQMPFPHLTPKYPDSNMQDQRMTGFVRGYGYQATPHITNNNPYGYTNNENEVSPHNGMKREYEEGAFLHGEKQSSIAGVIYNSSAVFKRLKPSLSEEESEVIYKEETNRSQGRPFSSNLTGRFIFHDNLKSLLNHVDKKNNNNFVVYDMSKHGKSSKQLNEKQDNHENQDTTKSQVKHGEATEDGQSTIKKIKKPVIKYPKEGQQITQMLFKNLKESLSNNDVVRMGIINDKLNSEVSMEALDNFLDCTHDDIMKIDGYREQFTPVQKTISYNPKCKTKQAKKEETSTDEAGDADDKSDKKTKDKRFNFHTLIKENMGLDEYVFVKTIRDNNGHILKLETIKPPVDRDGKFSYTSEWLKRRICYPRYKGGMNLHLLGPSFNFILYNDIKMLLWDIKEEILSRDEKDLDRILSRSDIVVDDDLKEKLFGNKVVYTQTLDR